MLDDNYPVFNDVHPHTPEKINTNYKGVKKITLVSKDENILYKVACYVYNILQFPIISIDIINENRAIVYYKPFKVEMKRS